MICEICKKPFEAVRKNNTVCGDACKIEKEKRYQADYYNQKKKDETWYENKLAKERERYNRMKDDKEWYENKISSTKERRKKDDKE